MNILETDVAVIGGGAAGMSAGAVCAQGGARTLIIDREEIPGGVLNQCIHNGFGLHYFKEELTGPEFAARLEKKARAAGAEFMMSSTVTDLADEGSTKVLTVYSGAKGVCRIRAGSVILANGCRERNRGNLGIPGDRLAGIYTAGCAQKLLNMDGYLPGKSAVIAGSGDIGLIMARRLSWCGVKVKAVIEIRKHPSGLSRNIAQCLDDFHIPLRLGTTITSIRGNKRVEEVTVAPLGEDGKADRSREEVISCDTVLFSVGLLPETELAKQCGIELDGSTGNGARVDHTYMTSVRGIFSCGNVLHVHDLVDFVAEQSETCAGCVLEYLKQNRVEFSGEKSDLLPVRAGEALSYVVPHSFRSGVGVRFYMRPKILCRKASLCIFAGEELLEKKVCHYVKPAEMLTITLRPEKSTSLNGKTPVHLELCDVEGEER